MQCLMISKLTVVNVFASWCVPCRPEHPYLMRLAKDRGSQWLRSTMRRSRKRRVFPRRLRQPIHSNRFRCHGPGVDGMGC